VVKEALEHFPLLSHLWHRLRVLGVPFSVPVYVSICLMVMPRRRLGFPPLSIP
jgi:hypothetical protein